MARVEHTCTGCVPIDASIIDVYVTLVETNKSVTNAEAGRTEAEAARVLAETQRTSTFATDHGRAVADHSIAQSDHATAGEDHTSTVAATNAATAAAAVANAKAELVQARLDTADADHTRAEGDHSTAVSDHSTASSDHTAAQSDHATAGTDHTRAESDHSTASSDHTASGTATAAATAAAALATEKAALVQDKLDRADTDHTRAESDHTTAASDHTTAASDHTQAGADHTQASTDHSTASADHTQASADHTAAASDHTTAAADHTTAGADHTQALADHEVMAGYDTRLTAVEGDVTELEAKTNEYVQESLYENTFVQPILYELGDIGISVSGWTYVNSNKRVRTPENYVLHLFPGDVIGLTSYTNARFYIGIRKLSGSYTTDGAWKTADYIVNQEGYYCILVCNLVDTTQSSAEALGSLIRVTRKETISKTRELTERIGVVLDKELLIQNNSFSMTANQTNKAFFGYNVGKRIRECQGGYVCIFADMSEHYQKYINYSFFNNSDGTRTNIGGGQVYPGVWCIVPVPVATDSLDALFYANKNNEYSGQAVTGKVSLYIVEVPYSFAVTEDTQYYNNVMKCGGHRGMADNVFPENTATAFREARRRGMAFVETDVRQCASGEYVMIHDPSINRTARIWDETTQTWIPPSTTLNVADLTLTQLRQYDFGAYRGDDFVGEKIMTLDEFLVLCKCIGLHPYIEQKINAASACIDAIRRNGMSGRATILADSASQIPNDGTLDKEIRYGLLVTSNNDVLHLSSMKENGFDVFALAIVADIPNYVSVCKTNKIPLEAYSVTNYSANRLDNYVSGFMSDNCVNYGRKIYLANIGAKGNEKQYIG